MAFQLVHVSALRADENPSFSCPVSMPREKPAAGGVEYVLGNDTFWTATWPGGRITVPPDLRESDGRLRVKWPWLSKKSLFGTLSVTAREIAAAGVGQESNILDSANEGFLPDQNPAEAFMPSILMFPHEGCWRVTARVGEETLEFVTEVKVGVQQ